MNGKFGVGDGVRTRDIQNHNLELYQAELRPPHAEEENEGSWRQERIFRGLRVDGRSQ